MTFFRIRITDFPHTRVKGTAHAVGPISSHIEMVFFIDYFDIHFFNNNNAASRNAFTIQEENSTTYCTPRSHPGETPKKNNNICSGIDFKSTVNMERNN